MMSRTLRTTTLLTAVFALASPCVASAWTPYGAGYGYGYGTDGGEPPRTGPETRDQTPGDFPSAPGFPGYGPGWGGPYPYAPPWAGSGAAGSAPGFPPQAPPYPGYAAPPTYSGAFAGAGRPGYASRSRFRVSRETSEDAYILNIEVQGIEPAELQVSTRGQRISIRTEVSQKELREDSFDDARGRSHSYSFSTGSASQGVTVPPDGDLAAMSREEGEGYVRITIPRRRD